MYNPVGPPLGVQFYLYVLRLRIGLCQKAQYGDQCRRVKAHFITGLLFRFCSSSRCKKIRIHTGIQLFSCILILLHWLICLFDVLHLTFKMTERNQFDLQYESDRQLFKNLLSVSVSHQRHPGLKSGICLFSMFCVCTLLIDQHKGPASIYDVRKILGSFEPLPPLSST